MNDETNEHIIEGPAGPGVLLPIGDAIDHIGSNLQMLQDRLAQLEELVRAQQEALQTMVTLVTAHERIHEQARGGGRRHFTN